MTYAESQNKPPFDWNAELQKKINGEEFTVNKWELRDMACEWPTCACGNQCAAIPRNEYSGAPLDEKLRALGTEFYCRIVDSEWVSAKAILAEIEQRSAEILATL